MKKTILTVVAVVLTLGASTAFARPQILPLAVQEPVDFVTQQMWAAINLLQDQINQFGSQTVQNTQRINELEQRPMGKSLKVYDANNQEIGLLAGHDIYSFGASETRVEVYLENFEKLVTLGEFDGLNKNSITNHLFFSNDNCLGDTFLPTHDLHGAISGILITAYPINSFSWVVPTSLQTNSYDSYYGMDENNIIGCHNTATTTYDLTKVQLIYPVPSYPAPLQIRAD